MLGGGGGLEKNGAIGRAGGGGGQQQIEDLHISIVVSHITYLSNYLRGVLNNSAKCCSMASGGSQIFLPLST